jgi:dTDP-4-dehydrorhamnose 3,5-epimerase-like enzyme
VSSVDECRIVNLPRHRDDRGSLTFVEPPLIAFDIRRVYYLYDMPAAATRGAHGHRRLEQLMIAVSGSMDVEVDDGRAKRVFHLSSPDQGLYIAPMIWRALSRFAVGSVCVVLASERYDEADYYRDYAAFLAAVNAT